jgi:hypothetical protein
MTAVDLAARRAAAASVLADYQRELHTAPLSRPPGREWMLRLATELESLLGALDAPVAIVRPGAPAPIETEQQARELPEVRAVYAAFNADPGTGKMAPHNYLMLVNACEAARVDLGSPSSYDRQILAWLAGFEPQTCAVVAGLITRAASADTEEDET